MAAGGPLRMRVAARTTTGAGLFCALLLVGAVLVPGLPVGGRLLLGCVGGGLGLLFAWAARRRRGVLVLDDHIHYRRAGVSVDLPRHVAQEIRIHRPALPLRGLTDYWLVIEAGGEQAKLLVAEHWLSGAQAMARVRALASALQIPVRDARGEQMRAAPLAPMRWAGAGQEWKLALFVAAAALLITAVLGEWLLSR